MIGLSRVDCRVVLQPGVTPSQRLALMEVLEKWSLALVGARPSRLVGSSDVILFAVSMDRDLALRSLRECLPGELVQDVFVDGVSWNR